MSTRSTTNMLNTALSTLRSTAISTQTDEGIGWTILPAPEEQRKEILVTK